ncbi:MAG: LCP family protein [Cellulosilyticaceae bacterium]
MSDKKGKLKKNQKNQLVKLFFKIMIITFVVCSVIVGGVVWSYNNFIHDNGGNITSDNKEDKTDKNKKPEKNKNINKNLAVLGVDKDGYRTDVIFVVNFNSETGKAKVVSVPRDTKVVWTESQKDKLRQDGKYVVSVSKINEMTAYGGIENIREYTLNQLETMLNIKIDNYVIVSISAFKEIVDAIGGVDMYVPQNMYYTDTADGLYINLKEGQQHLDGEKAEQLIRFRRYPEGDVARVRTQQLFLEAFAEKVMSPAIITKIPKLVNVLFDSVQTDIALSEIPEYYKHAKEFDLNNLAFHIIPGEGAYENGVSYFFPYYNEMDEFLDQIYNELTPAQEAENNKLVIDKTVTIEVLNGSGITGAAATAKEALESAGYVVGNIGNYTSSDVEVTTIYAKEVKLGNQFKEYYPNCKIKANPNLTTDIQIVLGTTN